MRSSCFRSPRSQTTTSLGRESRTSRHFVGGPRTAVPSRMRPSSTESSSTSQGRSPSGDRDRVGRRAPDKRSVAAACASTVQPTGSTARAVRQALWAAPERAPISACDSATEVPLRARASRCPRRSSPPGDPALGIPPLGTAARHREAYRPDGRLPPERIGERCGRVRIRAARLPATRHDERS